MTNDAVLSISDLSVHYELARGTSAEALSGAHLDVGRGRVHGLVGGSGSGKSSLIKAVLGLSAHNARVSGRIDFAGAGDLLRCSAKELRRLRGSQIGYIGQDGAGSLHPLMTVGAQFRTFFRQHRVPGSRARHLARAAECLSEVGMPDPEAVLRQYPFQLSGGMAQRVVIAIATALSPALVLADEPTSALDLTVQRRVLDLLAGLRADRGLGILLITHDLGVVAHYCDEVTVLHRGRVVESGPVREVFADPRDPYTRALLRRPGAPEPAPPAGREGR